MSKREAVHDVPHVVLPKVAIVTLFSHSSQPLAWAPTCPNLAGHEIPRWPRVINTANIRDLATGPQ